MQVMLNCILGMVEKTQSALTILQQRQSEAATLRTTEEAVADVQVCTLFLPTQNSLHISLDKTKPLVQARANLAILEVKQAAMEEIRAARGGRAPPEEAKEGGQVLIFETFENCNDHKTWDPIKQF